MSLNSLPPAIPRPEKLPLGDLPWERFELFCEYLVACIEDVITCHRYGKQGSTQEGIDIYADLKNGERCTYQCKRIAKLSRTVVERIINKTTFAADNHVILVSCEASTDVRKAVGEHPGWDIWDVGDLSRKVRELAPHDARRVVETHFGNQWRKDFLGLVGTAVFISLNDYFKPFLNPTRLLNHCWDLIGRTDALDQQEEFLKTPTQTVAIVIGRGGTGKTRVLLELGRRVEASMEGSLLFAVDGIPATPESFDDLPEGPCTIVVDDAHRRSDLNVILATVHRRRHQTKLVLSSRPWGLERIIPMLTQYGYDPWEITRLEQLGELSFEEMKQLAAQVVGIEKPEVVNRLARLTHDCPLVTVVGGRLLCDSGLDPLFFEADEDFRKAVFSRFHDEVLGIVQSEPDRKNCSALLQLISAVQPVDLDDPQIQNSVREMLKIDRIELIRLSSILEEADVLVKRGKKWRIVPDVLADYILHESCLDKKSEPTSYADLVFTYFANSCFRQVIINLSELDWRVRVSTGSGNRLLDGVWMGIEKNFKQASFRRRCHLLSQLETVAYFQPERAIKLIEFAIKSPASESEDDNGLLKFSQDDVLSAIPLLLQNIGYNLEFLPRCCDLLWELGRNDTRPLNQHPEHAIRILQDMAGYDIGKAIETSEVVLNQSLAWFADSDLNEYVNSPLDVIDQILTKSGYSIGTEGFATTMSPFVISQGGTERLRKKARSVITESAFAENIRLSIRALWSVKNALRDPIGLFGREVSKEEIDQWQPEQIELINNLESIATANVSPLTHLALLEVLHHATKYSSSKDVKRHSLDIFRSVEITFDVRVANLLVYPFGHGSPLISIDKEIEISEFEELFQRETESTIEDFVGRFKDPKDGLAWLSNYMQLIASVKMEPKPGRLLCTLATFNPQYAISFTRSILNTDGHPLAPYIGSLLLGIRRECMNEAIELAEQAINTQRDVECLSVASVYGFQQWADPLEPGDMSNIHKLLEHENGLVRATVVPALAIIGRRSPKEALAIVQNLVIGTDDKLAKALCSIFDSKYGVPFDALSAADYEHLVPKFDEIFDLHDWQIMKFLLKASEQDPDIVIDLFFTRVYANEYALRGLAAQPIPVSTYEHDFKGSLKRSGKYQHVLRRIRDEYLTGSMTERFWLSNLFSLLTPSFCDDVSAVLLEWVDSGDEHLLRLVGDLLHGLPRDLVFNHTDFVIHMLEKAYEIDIECYREIEGDLVSNALYGSRTRALGKPSGQDLEIRDRAQGIAADMLLGSLGHSFFSDLAKFASKRIEQDLAQDEDFLDE